MLEKFKNKVTGITGKKKPSRDMVILQTGVQLDKLKEKYQQVLAIQRRMLRSNPTPREKDIAEAKIRSAICAYTVVNQASKDLDEISSDMELNRTLRDLNQALKTINRLGSSDSGAVNRSLNKQIEKMQKREDSIRAEEIFSDASQASVDEWLGSRWGDVAQRYIDGADINDCLRESKIILETDPMPDFSGAFGNAVSDDPEVNLADLTNMVGLF